MAVGSLMLTEKETHRASPYQVLSSYKFGGRWIVTGGSPLQWLNHSRISLGGKQELYTKLRSNSCKIRT